MTPSFVTSAQQILWLFNIWSSLYWIVL